MHLIVNRAGNLVHSFDGELGDQVWEPRPVTRFNFLNPPDNKLVQELLAANYPTAGIIFEGTPYIGTSDGFICTPDREIQRIPDISVDSEIFVENFPFGEGEREAFDAYQEDGFSVIKDLDIKLVRRVFEIHGEQIPVRAQNIKLDRYLTGYIGIRGFAAHSDQSGSKLFDGHLLGVSETVSGDFVCERPVREMCLIDEARAGVVLSYSALEGYVKVVIKDGLEIREEIKPYNFEDLWDLAGEDVLFNKICPRDGSGCAPARFATDLETTVVSHGNHPCYILDIWRRSENGTQEKVRSLELDPQRTPRWLFVRNGHVYGDYGNSIRRFNDEKDVFIPDGTITSLTDTGLCTVYANGCTLVYDVFDQRNSLARIDGRYEFLESAPHQDRFGHRY